MNVHAWKRAATPSWCNSIVDRKSCTLGTLMMGIELTDGIGYLIIQQLNLSILGFFHHLPGCTKCTVPVFCRAPLNCLGRRARLIYDVLSLRTL